MGSRGEEGTHEREGKSTHSSTKNGLSASTTGSECERYDSYLRAKGETHVRLAIGGNEQTTE